jgi:hypothetical protein
LNPIMTCFLQTCVHSCMTWPLLEFEIDRLQVIYSISLTWHYLVYALAFFFLSYICEYIVDLHKLVKNCFKHKTRRFVVGANGIQQANMITLEKDYISILLKKTFSYEWILEQFFLQLVIIKAYNCPNAWYLFFKIIFE